jgi:hypothetical protein
MPVTGRHPWSQRAASVLLAGLAVAATIAPLLAQAPQPGPSRRGSDVAAFAVLHRWEVSTQLWLWPAGQTIEGCFKGGTPAQRRNVVDAGRDWMRHANISFDFGAAPGWRSCTQTGPHPPLRIEIAVGESNAKVGTTVFDVLELEPTMRLSPVNRVTGQTVPETAFRAIALHELGHVLGLRHEHQHPESRCVDNFAWPVLCRRVDQLARGTPTSILVYAAMNFVPRVAQADIAPPSYDPASIMHYRFTPPFVRTLRGACAGAPPRGLSEGDKARIAALYPRDPERQRERIRAHAGELGRVLAAWPGLGRAEATRIAAEARRLVSLGHPTLAYEVAVPTGDVSGPPVGFEQLALGDARRIGDLCRADPNAEAAQPLPGR